MQFSSGVQQQHDDTSAIVLLDPQNLIPTSGYIVQYIHARATTDVSVLIYIE
jgi:hypothetical protein